MARVLVLLLVLVPSARAQGILSRARAATYGSPRVPRAPKPAEPGPKNRYDDDYYSTNNTDGQGLLALGCLGLLAASSPIWAPMIFLDDNGTRKAHFPDHPYALDYANYLDTTGYGDNPVKGWGVRGAIEDGSRFDGLNRLGGRAWLDTTSRLGVTTNWDFLTEKLPGGGTDEMLLGDLMATWRFAQSDFMQMHAGLGGRGLFDRYRLRGGFNFLYSADVFPIEPVVVSSSVEVGHLNEAFTLRLRASVGMQWRHAEVFAGYDWLRIGGADIHGPLIGLRMWW